MSNQRCLNCLTEISGQFCSECGQSSLVKTIHFKDIVFDLFDVFKPWENKWGNNLKQIMLNPGVTARRYIRGERTPFFHPVKAFLFVLSVYLIVAHYFEYELMIDAFDIQESSTLSAEEIALNKVLKSFSEVFEKFIDYWFIFFVISSSIVSKLIFKKTKLTFGEHLVLNIIIGIGETVIYMVFIPFAKLHSEVDTYIVTPLLLAYNLIAFYQFFAPHYSSKILLTCRVICHILLFQILLLFILAFCVVVII